MFHNEQAGQQQCGTFGVKEIWVQSSFWGNKVSVWKVTEVQEFLAKSPFSFLPLHLPLSLKTEGQQEGVKAPPVETGHHLTAGYFIKHCLQSSYYISSSDTLQTVTVPSPIATVGMVLVLYHCYY